MRRIGVLVCLALLTACQSGAGDDGTDASASSDARPPVSLTPVDGTPARFEEAAIRMGFDATAAEELISPLPADLDFETDALVCVYLGERPTGGWGLDLQSASLVDGELRILGRETRPRGNVTQAVTYPGGCASLPRASLPTGDLAVRADDTISDEFIVDGRIAVPGS